MIYVTLASNAKIGRVNTINCRPTRHVNIGRGVSQPDSGVSDKDFIEIERKKTMAVIIFGRPAGSCCYSREVSFIPGTKTYFEAFGAHHPASPRSSFVAGSGADQVPQ